MLFNFFVIFLNNERYAVQPIRLLPHHIQYEVVKQGERLFFLEHARGENGEHHWSSAGHAVVDEATAMLIKNIGREIETYNLEHTNLSHSFN